MKIGILGYGSIGKRHHANIIAMGHDAVIYDPFIEEFAGNRSMILDHSDAVVICSPSTEHERDLKDVMAVGLPVLCEKPFGYDDPEAMRDLLIGERQIIATGFNLRFHSCVKEAKRLLPEIGEPVFASFTVYQKTEKPVYLRDGILRNWCSHEIDLANHLLGTGGKVIGCTVDGKDGQDTSEAWISMAYPTARAFIQADYYSDPERRYFFIEGSEGSIYVDLIGRNVFRSDKNINKRWQAYAGHDTFDENYVEEMQYFLMSVMSGNLQVPLASGHDGVTALYQVLDARKKAGLP